MTEYDYESLSNRGDEILKTFRKNVADGDESLPRRRALGMEALNDLKLLQKDINTLGKEIKANGEDLTDIRTIIKALGPVIGAIYHEAFDIDPDDEVYSD